MTETAITETNAFFIELKKLKNTDDLKKQADRCLGCLKALQPQLDDNLKAREELLKYPKVLRKSRTLEKNYEDALIPTNDILIQMNDIISSYIKRDSEYRKAFQALYERFEKGEYKEE